MTFYEFLTDDRPTETLRDAARYILIFLLLTFACLGAVAIIDMCERALRALL